MAMMVMAYQRWILEANKEGVLIPLNSRAVLSAVLNLNTSSFSMEYNKAQLVHRKPMVFITPNGTKDQVYTEIEVALQRDMFQPYPYQDFSKPNKRVSFYRQVEAYCDGGSNVCPLVVMS